MFAKYHNQNVALLILRLGLAYVFFVHGLDKIIHTGMYLKFFTRLGLPFPTFTVWLVCGVELLGGLAMLAGIWVELFGLLLAIDMLGVIITVRMGPMAKGWLGGHEFELMLLLMALAVAFMGAGKYALQRPKQNV